GGGGGARRVPRPTTSKAAATPTTTAPITAHQGRCAARTRGGAGEDACPVVRLKVVLPATTGGFAGVATRGRRSGCAAAGGSLFAAFSRPGMVPRPGLASTASSS